MQTKWWRSGFLYILLLVVVGALILARVTSGAGPEPIDKIGDFIEKVKQEQIDTIKTVIP
jgi:hypothetical protein